MEDATGSSTLPSEMQEVAEIAEALKHNHCLKALENIITFIDGGGRRRYMDRQDALGSAEGLITNILIKFHKESQHSAYCSKALATLLKLCHYNSNGRYSGHLQNIKRLGAAGACPSVVKALQVLVSEAISAASVYNWILKECSEKHKLDDFVIHEIGQFLFDEKKNIEIVQFGCDVIRILGWCNPENTSSLVCSGACEALVGAIKVHRNCGRVVVEGCEVMNKK